MKRRMTKGTVTHGQIDPMCLPDPMYKVDKGGPSILQERIHDLLDVATGSYAYGRNRPHGCHELEQIAPLLRARINLWNDPHAETHHRVSIRPAETGEAEIEQDHLKGRNNVPRVSSYPQCILYRDLPNPEIIRLQIPMIEKDILLQKAKNKAHLSENL